MAGDGLLEDIEDNLRVRFAKLARSRQGPVFALEHGLPSRDITTLSTGLRERARGPEAALMRCWCVYAAELGYRYDGSYWPAMQRSTPGWVEGHRAALRQLFERFAREHRGYRPSGDWSAHFRNICWPICHAVLSVDLHGHFLQCLEAIGHLTPSSASVAASTLRHWIRRSSEDLPTRLRRLAETEVLGVVAAALLGGSAHGVALDQSVIRRVEADLAERGRGDDLDRLRRTRPDSEVLDARVPRPGLQLWRDDRGWALWAELPSLRGVGLDEALAAAVELRAGGIARRPGWFTEQRPHLVQLQRFDRLFETRDAPDELTRLVAAWRAPPLRPPMLFERKGHVARWTDRRALKVGRRYLVLSDPSAPLDLPEASPSLLCEGASLWSLDDVTVLSSAARCALQVTIRPALTLRILGQPPVEGEAPSAWLVGDRLSLGVTLGGARDWTCEAELDGLALTGEIETGHWIVFPLGELEPGEHALAVTALFGDTIEDGALRFTIRPARPERANAGYALAAHLSPPHPSLEESLARQITVDVAALGEHVSLEAALVDERGEILQSASLKTAEIDPRWPGRLLDEMRQRSARLFMNAASAAEGLTLTVDAGALGRWSRSLERAAHGPRWVKRLSASREGGARSLRLAVPDRWPDEIAQWPWPSPLSRRALGREEMSALYDGVYAPPLGLYEARVDAQKTSAAIAPRTSLSAADFLTDAHGASARADVERVAIALRAWRDADLESAELIAKRAQPWLWETFGGVAWAQALVQADYPRLHQWAKRSARAHPSEAGRIREAKALSRRRQREGRSYAEEDAAAQLFDWIAQDTSRSHDPRPSLKALIDDWSTDALVRWRAPGPHDDLLNLGAFALLLDQAPLAACDHQRLSAYALGLEAHPWIFRLATATRSFIRSAP